MRIVIVSNYLTELDGLEQSISAVFPEWQVTRFTDPFLSARYVEQNHADLALVAARLRPPMGVELLRVLRRSKPELPVVLFADTEEYRAAARDAGACDYLVLPLTEDKLKEYQQAEAQTGW